VIHNAIIDAFPFPDILKGGDHLFRLNRINRFIWLVTIFILINRSFAQSTSDQPLNTGRFRLIFQDVEEFPVTAVKGLVSETLIDHSQYPSKIDPQEALKPAELIVIRIARKPDALWQWRESILQGRKDTRHGRVDLIDRDGNPLLTWEVIGAWPFKWIWPELDALSPGPALEIIHFICREIRPPGASVIPLPKVLHQRMVPKQ